MKFVLVVVMAVAAVCGWVFQDPTYQLNKIMDPADEAALAHRDSPYSSITWVASPSENFLQLRFFDRVEGGACLHPSWGELIAMAAKQPTLAHLVPAPGDIEKTTPGTMWPYSWLPDPGCLSNSAYIRIFPACVLLNKRLMTAAGGDYRATRPRILVVGLGSGIGIATLAYHFPLAAITVVDIDQAVVDMVCAHFPLLKWLSTQHLADGTPRLRFTVADARQFMRFQAKREADAGHPYDAVILDAYTSGSTIPPHLMTREFYGQCAAVIEEHGVLMANIIGSYAPDPNRPSTKYLVLGGAIRTMAAMQEPAIRWHVWNFPVMTSEDPAHFDPTSNRNNMVIASRQPLDPKDNAIGWERLEHFVPYSELPSGQYVSSSYALVDMTNKRWMSAAIPGAIIDKADPSVRAGMTSLNDAKEAALYPLHWESKDRQVMKQCARIVAAAVADGTLRSSPVGWSDIDDATALRRHETDWVLAAQETFRVTVQTARDGLLHSGEALIGDLPEGPARAAITSPTWYISDAPLFTDQRPNADIFNN